jgi:hypothetical protein
MITENFKRQENKHIRECLMQVIETIITKSLEYYDSDALSELISNGL